jgi:hypothetical protein
MHMSFSESPFFLRRVLPDNVDIPKYEPYRAVSPLKSVAAICGSYNSETTRQPFRPTYCGKTYDPKSPFWGTHYGELLCVIGQEFWYESNRTFLLAQLLYSKAL